MSGWMRWAAVALAMSASSMGCGGDAPQSQGGELSLLPEPRPRRDTASRSAGGNRAPRVEAVRFEPGRPGPGEPVRAIVTSSDPEGDPLTHRFEWTVGGRRLAVNGPRLWYARTRTGEWIELRVTASDGRAESAPFLASLRVSNRAPRLAGVRIEPAEGGASGTELVARPDAVDPDGDRVSFRYTWWVNGRAVDADGPAFDTTGLRRGDSVQVRVVASDGQDQSEDLESGEVVLVNAAPRIVSEPGAAGEDGVFRYRAVAEDPDGDHPLRFSLLEAPEGMTVTRRGGAIEWRPRADQAGLHRVALLAEDLHGGRSIQRFRVVVDPGGEGTAQDAPPANLPGAVPE